MIDIDILYINIIDMLIFIRKYKYLSKMQDFKDLGAIIVNESNTRYFIYINRDRTFQYQHDGISERYFKGVLVRVEDLNTYVAVSISDIISTSMYIGNIERLFNVNDNIVKSLSHQTDKNVHTITVNNTLLSNIFNIRFDNLSNNVVIVGYDGEDCDVMVRIRDRFSMISQERLTSDTYDSIFYRLFSNLTTNEIASLVTKSLAANIVPGSGLIQYIMRSNINSDLKEEIRRLARSKFPLRFYDDNIMYNIAQYI